MFGTRQGLLNSASYGTVILAAGLTCGLEPARTSKTKSRKKASRNVVRSAIGAGALALAVGFTGLTAAPHRASARGMLHELWRFYWYHCGCF